MNDQGKKSSFQTLAAGFVGFVGVIGLGSLVILHHGGAAVQAPVVAYAPVDAASSLAVPARPGNSSLAGAPLGTSGAVAASPAPLLPDEVRDGGSAATPAAAAAAPAPASAAAAKLATGQHLDAGSSASSSASASASTAPRPKMVVGKKPFAAPKLDLSKNQGTIASTVHYGVSSRAELMGRAAGPVYNFAGKGAGQQSAQVAADNAASPDAANAMQQVDAAQKQLDASDVDAGQKTQIDQNLDQVRKTAAGSVTTGQ